jgi:citrate/tricarballylate utilization protein
MCSGVLPERRLRAVPLTDTIKEAERLMTICNSCRYCEGFCAVFPAMERRKTFGEGDLTFLANLCHGCQGCYYACQYAPPHEFEVNVPQTFSTLRAETYADFAWPGFLGSLFKKNGVVVSLAVALGLAVLFLLMFGLQDPSIIFGSHSGEGAFYRVIPYSAMVWPFGVIFVFAILAMVMGGVRYWREAAAKSGVSLTLGAILGGVWDVLTLKNLGGGGGGCNYPDESFSGARRVFHHFTFYGFMLCFAATSVATIYDHWFGWIAPYSFTSLPVLLGIAGGIGLLIGPVGLMKLKIDADPAPRARELVGMDVAFLMLLFLVAFTGLALMVLRETGVMGTLLAVHLGFVLALFVTLPYGKMVHGVYRFLALVQDAAERKAS